MTFGDWGMCNQSFNFEISETPNNDESRFDRKKLLAP